MASTDQSYSVEQEVSAFFDLTSVTRSVCDKRARELVGGDITLVPIQGCCSYTVYAGIKSDAVVQFRLESLHLPLETARLAYSIFGPLVPHVRFEGHVGEDDDDGRERLYVYVMVRMKGVSRLDFILAHGFPEDTPENCAKRLTLVIDAARYVVCWPSIVQSHIDFDSFFALSWKSPQKLDQAGLEELQQSYERDLRLLLSALPERFEPHIQTCLREMSAIMALPLVLTHKDFGDSNILVDPDTCHLLGVIDWAEATIEPFGVNLYSMQRLMGKFHLRNGYIRYEDYDVLHAAFWDTLRSEVGDWSDDTLQATQSAMVLGLLLSRGFTSRLANAPKPIPISDDESGAYSMLCLDSWLTNPETRMIGQ